MFSQKPGFALRRLFFREGISRFLSQLAPHDSVVCDGMLACEVLKGGGVLLASGDSRQIFILKASRLTGHFVRYTLVVLGYLMESLVPETARFFGGFPFLTFDPWHFPPLICRTLGISSFLGPRDGCDVVI